MTPVNPAGSLSCTLLPIRLILCTFACLPGVVVEEEGAFSVTSGQRDVTEQDGVFKVTDTKYKSKAESLQEKMLSFSCFFSEMSLLCTI